MKQLKNNLFYYMLSFGIIISPNLLAQEVDESIFEMSLEDLMNLEITSVSKKAERLQDVASSIYVLTSDDIRKSGATTLHELLRTVPGYWGTQTSYSRVESSIRVSPTPNTFSGTVLYLLDGTPIQDQMNSSFSFHNFDIPMNEIERIEVIRGSGGTIYGANSATGVVNIFTKNPEDYEGLHINAEGATPGYVAASLSMGGQISDKVSLSGYTKIRSFNGWDSMAGKDEQGNTVVSPSRFTQEYDKSMMNSMGLKLGVKFSDQTKLSIRSHFNTLNKYEYTNIYPAEGFDILSQTITDELVLNDVNANRLVSNLRLDHSFNEDHNVFFRVSSNRENDFLKAGGGLQVSNVFYDLEVQDNVSLGSYNDLSIGANYRFVNFDIHDINSTETINFVDPQAKESIKGAFIQDKIKLMDGKLNFLLGAKAENYSLVNDDYYLSPMAKVSYIPNDNLTIWGGFTQSFTTPGFNNTNIDLFLFSTPSSEAWTSAVTQGVYDEAYATAYGLAIDAGAPESLAQSIADTEANNYVASTEGQATISGTTTALMDQYPSFAAKNGSNTVPTKFRTLEAGFRTKVGEKWSFESNLYYTQISDGIAVQDQVQFAEQNEESTTQPGRFANYFLYGNYVKGETYGAESMIRFRPMSTLLFELSHSYLKSTWELQENDDFNIHAPGVIIDKTPDTPKMPENIFKLKTSYDATESLNVSLGLIYASEFLTQSNYLFDQERYENLAISEPSTVVAENDKRIIVNLRVEKRLMDNQVSFYAFGNDIFNSGIVANTNNVYNVTLSQIGAMFGLGLNYNFQ